MGKKGKRHVKKGNGPSSAEGVSYPSDGPSQEELMSLQTSSTSLQAKLDQLTQLALNNNRSEFVAQFVPLDLSKQDADAYLQELTTAPEAEVTKAIFYFSHPILQGCNREVSFLCIDGEWRAEG